MIIKKSPSMIAGVSLVLSITAWLFLNQSTLLILLPTLLDPGTWIILLSPFLFIIEKLKD